MLQETQKVTVGISYVSRKAKKGQAIVYGPSGLTAGKQVGFCLQTASSQAHFLTELRQRQQKEVGDGPQSAHRMEIERGQS